MKREFIYCITQCQDTRWLLLDRRYKPFGIHADRGTWYNFEECRGTRLWLRQSDLEKLDGGARPYRQGDKQLWLWYDATAPWLSAACRKAYLRRVALLGLEEEAA